ncbi:TniQ family protein [Siccirubricoccus sp. KC 17139]|uniref:TniQ family protein n=1 Tax=Siccirubricoccus soli TaxID=2899147 RepID=A0ABT1D1L0_9PROT|nr:TniQ family protein [Siccirubricoccus soli]MCO6415783.1 TniQ family protein [Siccirubricoccus soli]MCP2681915.1 TniQ family protein [Siccirubricoccus soli]
MSDEAPPPPDGPRRLPLPVDRLVGESLPSRVARTAKEHGFSRPLRVLKPLGVGTKHLASLALKGADVDHLGEYLGMDPGELDIMCYGDGTTRTVLGHELHADLVAVRTRQACPACLAENAYHRALWDMTFVTACPVHGTRLLDRCPAPCCGKPLGWNLADLAHCSSLSCTGDLREATPPRVPEAELGGVRALYRLLTDGACPEWGEQVAALPVGEQLLLMFHVGLVALGHERVTRPVHFVSRHPDEVHLVLEAGWRACQEWPRGFEALLDKRRARAEEAARKRLDRAASEALRSLIGAAVCRELGPGMVQRRAVLRDDATGGRVQVMTAGNNGVAGTYLFQVRRTQTQELASAPRAHVALGFADRSDFLLVPWGEFAAHLERLGGVPESGPRLLVLRAAPDGTLSPFGAWARPVRRTRRGSGGHGGPGT